MSDQHSFVDYTLKGEVENQKYGLPLCCVLCNKPLGVLEGCFSLPMRLLGFNDNIYHEGNISKMPVFDVFSVLECNKRKSRSHGKRKNGNIKRKICTEKRLNTSLKDLSLALTNHGRHGLFSFLSSLPISVLRNLELEANKLYDRANKLYKAALLTRCYVQHFLSPYIDS